MNLFKFFCHWIWWDICGFFGSAQVLKKRKGKMPWGTVEMRFLKEKNHFFVLSHVFLSQLQRQTERYSEFSYSWPCESNLAFNSNHLMCTSAEQSKLTEQAKDFSWTRTKQPNTECAGRSVETDWEILVKHLLNVSQ